jgi:LysM repeat protein
MKKQLQQIRRFFVRTKNYNASLARPVSHSTYDEDDDGGNRLSGAFIVVLALHIVAVVGVFAFARIKETRGNSLPAEPSTQTAAGRAPAAKAAPPVAPVAAATLVPPVNSLKSPQAGSRPPHVVKPGETLTKIAVAYNVSVAELVSLNTLKNQDDIQVGQALDIPEVKPPATARIVADKKSAATPSPSSKTVPPSRDKKPSNTYIVQSGDSVLKIARQHGCSYEELVKLNNIKDPKKIIPGQVLKLPVKKG